MRTSSSRAKIDPSLYPDRETASEHDEAREHYIRMSQASLERDLRKQEKAERARLFRRRIATPVSLVVITAVATAFLWYWEYVRR